MRAKGLPPNRAVYLRVALATVLAALALAPAASADWTVIPHGDVAGGDELVLPLGGISGFRNLQCGEVTGNAADLNCDIGAGDATHPGYVVVDWDLGKGFLIYAGAVSPHTLVAAFLPSSIDFYAPVNFHAGAVGLPPPVVRVVRVTRYVVRRPRRHHRRRHG